MRLLGRLTARFPISRGAGYSVVFLFLLNFMLTAFTLLYATHYVNSTQARFAQQQAQQQAATARSDARNRASALAAARGECRALLGLDDAREGIDFSAPSKTGTAELYVLRLVAHIHDVYVHSGCPGILRGTRPTAGTGQP